MRRSLTTPEWLLSSTRTLPRHREPRSSSRRPGPRSPRRLDPSGRLPRMNALAELSIRQIDARTVSWTIVANPERGVGTHRLRRSDFERLWDAVARAVRLDDPILSKRGSVIRQSSGRARALNELHLDGRSLPRPVRPDRRAPGGLPLVRRLTHRLVRRTRREHAHEEVFTTPDRRDRGSVRSTRPLACRVRADRPRPADRVRERPSDEGRRVRERRGRTSPDGERRRSIFSRRGRTGRR